MTTPNPPETSDELAPTGAGAGSAHAAPLSGPSGPLPTLSTALAPAEVITRLKALAKRGKLPEFQTLDEGAGPDHFRFKVLAFGSPYDRELLGDLRRSREGSRVSFTTRLKRKMPWIVIATMVFSLWPGVWLTDSMLGTYFSWYPRQFWITCAWYLPLTLLAVPVLWKQFKKSEALTHADSLETITKIAATIDAH